MSHKFVVVYEAPADFRVATELADRVILDKIDWLDEAILATQRQWIAEDGGRPLKWSVIAGLARAAGIRVQGQFDGVPGEPDARAGRRALAYLFFRFDDLAAAVLVRDVDDQPERREGLQQAKVFFADRGKPIVLGVAVVERESWVIAGFEPRDADESDRLQAERQKLGFNPCERPHELTACKDDAAVRSPKRVLAALVGNDNQRERECWITTPLPTLRARGTENGLAAYLNDVEVQLVPIIRGY